MARISFNDITCDRCGREITEKRLSEYYNCAYGNSHRVNLKWGKLHLWNPDDQKGVQPSCIDLCCDCYNEFVEFLDDSRE